MRITYRQTGSKAYWEHRWLELPIDAPMSNISAYPLMHALWTVENNPGPILEAGCGAGRIIRYFHERGYPIFGFDYVESIVAKLKHFDGNLQVCTADITCMPYPASSFVSVFAFGVLHSLPLSAIQVGLYEINRVLKPGGRVCLSFRADNLQNQLTDYLKLTPDDKENQHFSKDPEPSQAKIFHKINLTANELKTLVIDAGFYLERFNAVQNMPLLYRYKFFRSAEHKYFNENKARSEGYKLSFLGRQIQKILMIFPNSFCNLYVVVARKPSSAPQ